ncbi:hypothetical protein GE061_016834 [Apolygus lucorum]|uniref:Uncharacterized protein n=1 Tax=Apolygus lucorum TaxID=248454 RepID=A0A6A4JMA9_APOLU|nr:hypothetical protein GE061_016834 [Apolygus lucorum]
MDCAKCSRELHSPKKTAQCSACEASYHPSCTRLKTVENYKKLKRDLREQWICDICKNGKSKKVQEESEDDSGDDSDKEEAAGSCADDKLEALLKTVNEMNKKMRKIEKITSIEEQLTDIKKSVQFMSDQFDDFSKRIQSFETMVTDLQEENGMLRAQVGDLQHKVDFLELESRKSNVEIHGVPETSNEDCMEVVRSVASAADIEITPSFAVRIGKIRSDRPRVILAGMSSGDKVSELIKNTKAKKINANDVHKDWPGTRIYANENLTPMKRDLLYKAKMKARAMGYKFVWIAGFRIYVKKDETMRPIVIWKEEDLDKIK